MRGCFYNVRNMYIEKNWANPNLVIDLPFEERGEGRIDILRVFINLLHDLLTAWLVIFGARSPLLLGPYSEDIS